MRKFLVLNPASGASGDMIVGALADLTGGQAKLNEKLKKSGLNHKAVFRKVVRGHSSSLSVEFKGKPARLQPAKMKMALEKAARKAGLTAKAREFCMKALKMLVDGEKKAHGLKSVHFHELADIDTALDIFSAAVLLEEAGAFNGVGLFSLPVAVGSRVGPAALNILQTARFPIRIKGVAHELCTPTGAALISAKAKPLEDSAHALIEKKGCGAGSAEIKGCDNVLRALLMKARDASGFCVLEANVDDMTGEELAFVVEELLSKGANDACLVPIIAKKGRPGFVIQAMCSNEQAEKLVNVFFDETTTWGVRIMGVEKRMLARSVSKAKTPYGEVRVKSSKEKWKAEFEDAARIAREKKIPLRRVLRSVRNKSNRLQKR